MRTTRGLFGLVTVTAVLLALLAPPVTRAEVEPYVFVRLHFGPGCAGSGSLVLYADDLEIFRERQQWSSSQPAVVGGDFGSLPSRPNASVRLLSPDGRTVLFRSPIPVLHGPTVSYTLERTIECPFRGALPDTAMATAPRGPHQRGLLWAAGVWTALLAAAGFALRRLPRVGHMTRPHQPAAGASGRADAH